MRIVVVGLALALLSAPAALAGPQPAVYFLEDTASGVSAPGNATADYPDENASSNVRLLAYGSVADPTHLFHAPESAIVRLQGDAIAGTWISPDLAVDAGVSAALYEIDANGNRTHIANATHSLLIDPEDVPDPASLLPPDPEDPEGAAYHVAAAVVSAMEGPHILHHFVGISHDMASGSHLAIGFYMSEGSGGIPLGVTGIEYGSQEHASFLFAPWYTPDPAPAPAPPAPRDPPSASEDEPEAMDEPEDAMEEETSHSDAEHMEESEAESDDSKDSPTAAPLLVLAALAAIAIARRRQS